MGSKRLDSIADYARHGLNLRVECRCGRVVLLDAPKLSLDCHRRGSSKVLAQLVERLRCRDCGGHRWTSAERGRHFADLLDAFDPMYGMLPERFYAETPHLIRLAELDAWQGAEFPEL